MPTLSETSSSSNSSSSDEEGFETQCNNALSGSAEKNCVTGNAIICKITSPKEVGQQNANRSGELLNDAR